MQLPNRMTLNDFLKNLKETKKDINWLIHPNYQIRGRSTTSYKLYCPITAVYSQKYKNYRSTVEADECGKDIGLSYNDTNKIILASDFCSWDDEKRQLELKEIKNKILGVLGWK